MKKIAFLLLITLFILTGCAYDRGTILFNTQPITKENVLNDSKHFQAGERVYYLFLSPNAVSEIPAKASWRVGSTCCVRQE